MARDEREERKKEFVERRAETFVAEFRLGLALVVACWHQQDVRQHTLGSSFVIHALNTRYERAVLLSHGLHVSNRLTGVRQLRLETQNPSHF